MSALGSLPPSVQVSFDDDHRRMTVVIEGQAGGRQVQGALRNVFEQRPEVTGFDYLFDLRSYRGDVSAGDLDPVAEIYASVRGECANGTRTAFITSDPLFGLWATAMNYQFPGRGHAAFPEAELAEEFLVEPRSARVASRTES
jgi:hypothetical protein